jgi:ferredoxin-NADP reductase
VPDETEEHLQLFTKVSGRFTARLANACASDNEPPAMCLQGPFGNPPLPTTDINAVVFVLGGVGVTPALSLVAEASKMCGDQVRVYWNLRSMELFKRSAPFLTPHLKPELQCIRITKAPESAKASAESIPQVTEAAPQVSPQGMSKFTQDVLDMFHKGFGAKTPDSGPPIAEPPRAQEVERLPLGAEIGREDVDEWISTVASDLVAKETKRALLFVCGPNELVWAAQRASVSSEKTTGIAWQLHVEQFQFLPSQSGACRCLQRQQCHTEDADEVV